MSLSPSAIVYDHYGDKVPPHPGQGWTRFVCISDTHSRTHYPVPDGDVLLHAGDLSSWGRFSQLKVTIDWLMSLPHPAKVIVGGNHDLSLDRKWAKDAKNERVYYSITDEDVDAACALVRSERAGRAGLHYLEHSPMELVTLKGQRWKIYGSPAAPRYAPGSFQYTRAEHAKEIYSHIPQDTEILLTHTPPHGTQDVTKRNIHAGCPHLSARMGELDKCRLHVFGHIHEGHGATVHGARLGTGNVMKVSVNAAVAWGGQAVLVDVRDD